MKRILQPAEGEVLKLGAPATGEVIIKIDPQQDGTPFVTGTETLARGAEIPVHRHRDRDDVWCVLRGQGRATVEEQVVTVVPGAIVYAPRQTWHGLRNTGTGMLQIAWVSTPAGIETFLRELSKLGASPEMSAVQEVAERHGIEFLAGGASAAGAAQPAAEAAQPHRGRRRRRGGRGRRRGGAQQQQQPRSSSGGQAKPAAGGQQKPSSGGQQKPPSGDQQGRPSGGRRSSRGRRTGAPSQKSKSPQRSKAPQRGRGGGGRRRRVKEVYMGGKWVRVEGDGPVIST